MQDYLLDSCPLRNPYDAKLQLTVSLNIDIRATRGFTHACFISMRMRYQRLKGRGWYRVQLLYIVLVGVRETAIIKPVSPVLLLESATARKSDLRGEYWKDMDVLQDYWEAAKTQYHVSLNDGGRLHC